MSSWTTTFEGEGAAPRFFVGSRDDEEAAFLGPDMKMDEVDFFEDDEEEEESVRWSLCLLALPESKA